LHRIFSHPFFNPASPVVPLSSSQHGALENDFIPATTSHNSEQNTEQTPSPRVFKIRPFPPKAAFTRTRERHSDASLPTNKRKTLCEIGNKDLRRLLSDDKSSNIKMSSVPCATRRVVSDPLPRKPGTLTASRVVSTSSSGKDTAIPSFLGSRALPEGQRNVACKHKPNFPLISHPLLSINDAYTESSAETKVILPSRRPSKFTQVPVFQPPLAIESDDDLPVRFLRNSTEL